MISSRINQHKLHRRVASSTTKNDSNQLDKTNTVFKSTSCLPNKFLKNSTE